MADFKVTELAEDLDFDSLPYWDVVIIGAGPGGLAASLTTAHRGLTTLVIEAKDTPGGQPQFLYADKKIVDIPGFPDGISGDELSARTYRQAVDALVQFRFNEELVDILDTDQVERVRAVVGAQPRRGDQQEQTVQPQDQRGGDAGQVVRSGQVVSVGVAPPALDRRRPAGQLRLEARVGELGLSLDTLIEKAKARSAAARFPPGREFSTLTSAATTPASCRCR